MNLDKNCFQSTLMRLKTQQKFLTILDNAYGWPDASRTWNHTVLQAKIDILKMIEEDESDQIQLKTFFNFLNNIECPIC